MIWFFFTIGALLASAGPAMADPTGGALTAFVASSVGKFLITAAITAASVGVQLLTAKSGTGRAASVARRSASRTDAFVAEEAPALVIVGRARVQGIEIFGNTKDLNRYRVIARVLGQVTAIEETYLGGREVIIGFDGAVTSPPYSEVGTGTTFVFIKEQFGTGLEQVWVDLNSAFQNTWDGNHRGFGITQSLVRYVSPGIDDSRYTKLYGNGFPLTEHLYRGELINDPRDGVTRWTDNAVLQLMHTMQKMLGFATSDFDLDTIKAEADKADAIVTTRSGTERRARLSGLYEPGEQNGETLKAMQQSGGVRIVHRFVNEVIKYGIIVVEDLPASEIALAFENNLEWSWASGPDGFDRPNVCLIKYYSPERGYKITEIDLSNIAWARIEDEISRYGEKSVTYELPFCPSAAQAQRIARRLFYRDREETFSLTYDAAGLATWGCLYGTIPANDVDEDPVLVEFVESRFNGQTSRTEIGARRVPVLTAYNPNADEALPPADLVEIPVNGELAQPSMPPRAAVVTNSGVQSTRVEIPMPGGVTQGEAAYRVYVNGLPGKWEAMTESTAPGNFWWAKVDAPFTGADVDFRSRAFDNDDNSSPWSPVLEMRPFQADVSAPPVPIVDAVISLVNPTNITVTVTVSAPVVLNVAYVTTTGPGALGQTGVTPGSVYSFQAVVQRQVNQFDQFWFANAFEETGNLSPQAFDSVTVPAL